MLETPPTINIKSNSGESLNGDSELVQENNNNNNNNSCTSTNKLNDHYNPCVRELNIAKISTGACGFHLSRSKWDPYPWVSGVEKESPAELSGLKVGDCVLEVNGEDVLGLRIAEVANLVKAKQHNVTLMLWTTGMEPTCNPESLCCGPMPINLQRLAACIQTVLGAMECPICLDTIPPPVIQCLNGHLICLKCRVRADKCPVCRERYYPGRSLIAEQIYNSIRESFKLKEIDGKLREKLFGAQCKKFGSNQDVTKVVQSHTNKFLARIMGKATSLDNLSNSNIKKDNNKDPIGNDETNNNNIMNCGNKQISLSVNELYRSNNSAPPSRSPSPNRLQSDLTNGGQINLGKRRPRSHNASMDSLNNGIAGSTIAEIVLNSEDAMLLGRGDNSKCFSCPCDEECDRKLKSYEFYEHITYVHKLPVISFGTAAAEIGLPPRAPIENAVLILTLDRKQFWMKLKSYDGHYFIAVLMQDDKDLCSKYYLEAKIQNYSDENRILSKEIISRCGISSLCQHSWKEILDKKDGILFTKDSLTATFDIAHELLLRVSVKSIADL